MAYLIAYDGSADSRHAIEFAAKHLSAERTVIVTVWEPLLVQLARHGAAAAALVPSEEPEEPQIQAEAHAKEGAELAIASGLSDVTYRAVADKSSIWQAIVDLADEIDASLVVTGSRGLSGVRSVLLGSVSNHVLHHARRPTLIVPPAQETR
ncbi:universal stress protein [Nonomuraea sp. NPDC049152]|uniref:universal stress protein n=1 Tax=Nonomuraea sp. NPDC049152 TaxID=3154350 RepID=UPI0033E9BA49